MLITFIFKRGPRAFHLSTFPHLEAKKRETPQCSHPRQIEFTVHLQLFLKTADNFLNKACVCWFFLRFGATPPCLPLPSPLTRLISRKVDATVGRWLLKGWQEKPSEVSPTRKALIGHPGEPAGSCLQYYPPVHNNRLTDTGWYRDSCTPACEDGRRREFHFGLANYT